jgi:hypothetical protein
MKPIRRIQADGAGFIKDVSDIIALEAWKDPFLISIARKVFLRSGSTQV